jgi:hypothetical protein
MKYTIKYTLTIICLLLAVVTHAQTPQGIPYQAAARNSSGAVLASTNISVRFTIRDSIATGVIKYRETHTVTTTAQGLFSVNVGQGSPVAGTFSGINWGMNAKFMQVELDPAGGSSYIDMGTQQMMSVPYALSSEALKLNVSTTGDSLYSGGGNYVIVPGISAANCIVSAGTITGTATVVAGSTTILSNATTGGTWSSSATGIATVSSAGVVTGVAAGTATISYTVSNSCGSAVATRVVTVNAASLTVGSTFGGGVIAYIYVAGDPGYVAGETHGIIAAPSNQSTGIQWYNGSYITTGATGTALGTGMANTNAIVTAQGAGTYAAKLCADLVLNGYSDWYLPSRDELTKLYINRSFIGEFAPIYYWSSSEYSAFSAWGTFFDVGITDYTSKSYTYYVRAVRAF